MENKRKNRTIILVVIILLILIIAIIAIFSIIQRSNNELTNNIEINEVSTAENEVNDENIINTSTEENILSEETMETEEMQQDTETVEEGEQTSEKTTSDNEKENEDTISESSDNDNNKQSPSKNSESSNSSSSTSSNNSSTSTNSEKEKHTHTWKDHTAQRWVSNIVTVVDTPEQTIAGAQLYTLHSDGNWYGDGEIYWFEDGFTSDDLKEIIKDKIKNEGYIGNYVNRYKTIPAETHEEDQGHYETYVDYQYCECGAKREV